MMLMRRIKVRIRNLMICIICLCSSLIDVAQGYGHLDCVVRCGIQDASQLVHIKAALLQSSQPIVSATSMYTSSALVQADLSSRNDLSIIARLPSTFPLQYITPDLIVQFITVTIPTSVISALLPTNSNDLVATFIAEGCSGFLGGVAGQLSSLLNRNKQGKKDSVSDAGLVSGVYFGVAGSVRSISQLVGSRYT